MDLSRPLLCVKQKGFANRPTDCRARVNCAIAQVLSCNSRGTRDCYYSRIPPPQNIERTTGSDNLITLINFFVVLPSIVITLNPRDWRDDRPDSAAPKMGALLFACGSTRMIRNRALRRGSHGAAGNLLPSRLGTESVQPWDRCPCGQLLVLELTTLGQL